MGRISRNRYGIRAAIKTRAAGVAAAIEDADATGFRILKNCVDSLYIRQSRLILAVRPTVADHSVAVFNHLVEQRLETAAAIERRVVDDNVRAGRDSHYCVNVEQHFGLVGSGSCAAVNVHFAELIDLRRRRANQIEKIAHVTLLECIELEQADLLSRTAKARCR